MPELTGDLGHHPGVGRRGSHAWACAPTPTTPRTPSSPATSAPRASACAAPSTCSWAIASRSSRRFILNDDEPHPRARPSPTCSRPRVGDFYGMFKAMDGLPVIVRLLDPPLHEFLDEPPRAGCRDRQARRRPAPPPTPSPRSATCSRRSTAIARAEPDARHARRAAWASVYPILPAMQVRAIATAALVVQKEGFDPQPRDHGSARRSVLPELAKLVRDDGRRPSSPTSSAAERRRAADIPVGTMIELPRAAVTADEIAERGRLLLLRHQRPHPDHLRLLRATTSRASSSRSTSPSDMLPYNPFATIDAGVAKLVEDGRGAGA